MDNEDGEAEEEGGGVLRKRTLLQGRQCSCLSEQREAEEEGGREKRGRDGEAALGLQLSTGGSQSL